MKRTCQNWNSCSWEDSFVFVKIHKSKSNSKAVLSGHCWKVLLSVSCSFGGVEFWVRLGWNVSCSTLSSQFIPDHRRRRRLYFTLWGINQILSTGLEFKRLVIGAPLFITDIWLLTAGSSVDCQPVWFISAAAIRLVALAVKFAISFHRKIYLTATSVFDCGLDRPSRSNYCVSYFCWHKSSSKFQLVLEISTLVSIDAKRDNWNNFREVTYIERVSSAWRLCRYFCADGNVIYCEFSKFSRLKSLPFSEKEFENW